MTEDNTHDIRTLAIEEYLGKISEEDQVWLHQHIQYNEAAREIYEDTIKNMKLQPTFDADVTIANIEDILAKRQRRKKNQLIALTSGIAASLLLFIGYNSFFRPSPAAHTLPVSSHQIEFSLSNGQKTYITPGNNGFQVGSVSGNANNNVLTYTADPNVDPNQLAFLSVPAGKDFTVKLSDGSTIQLNANSSTHFPVQFLGKTREITVEGEAFLTIAKDAAHPFIVHLATGDVQVLGTSFNVNTYDKASTKVSLVDGKVLLAASGQKTPLTPGNEGVIQNSQVRVRSFDADILSWRQGIYNFDKADIQEISQVLQRYYGVEVILDNQQFSGVEYTGSLDKHEPLETFLEEISDILQLQYSLANNQLHLSKKK